MAIIKIKLGKHGTVSDTHIEINGQSLPINSLKEIVIHQQAQKPARLTLAYRISECEIEAEGEVLLKNHGI